VSALLEIMATMQGCPYGWHLPQGILWTSDCEARYGGTVDTRLHKSKITSPSWVVWRTRNNVEGVSL
jgi:hypothetical protein